MIHELREYWLELDKWKDYWQLFNQECMPIRGIEFGRLRGMWLDADSPQVHFFHIWEYASLDERARLRMALLTKPGWRDSFLAKSAPLVQKQRIQILNPQRVTENMTASDDLVHLIRYSCAVGRANEFRQRMDETGQSNLGNWTTEFPNPNQVVVLTSNGGTVEPPAAGTYLLSTEVTQLRPLLLEQQ